jgi:hypothetical protein
MHVGSNVNLLVFKINFQRERPPYLLLITIMLLTSEMQIFSRGKLM